MPTARFNITYVKEVSLTRCRREPRTSTREPDTTPPMSSSERERKEREEEREGKGREKERERVRDKKRRERGK